MSAPFAFLHAADLHLGRRFGSLPEGLRGRLAEARHAVLPRLAAVARSRGIGHILLAGDTFDTETPAPQVWRQALAAVAADPAITWWVIPGNHDSLAAEALWDPLRRAAPGNLRLLDRAEPVQMAPGAVLLPAPLPRRHAGRDLTGWMADAPTPAGALRLGLAHGPVRSFAGEDAGAEAIVPPDRAVTARLDYLALGDWHGTMQVGPRAWYAGTPEADDWRRDPRGGVLAVALPGPGAEPQVERVETGALAWVRAELALLPGEDGAAALARLLPADRAARRDVLMRVVATGRARAAGRAALEASAAAAAPEFALLELDAAALATEFEAADLDAIAPAGALRAAADALRAEAEGGGDDRTRALAAAALNRLYGLVAEGGAG